MNPFKHGKIFDIALLTFAFAVFLVLSWVLRGWLIDDAGISFAYARSIAEGYGMVHQQGAQPVEGISNPLWTFLFVMVQGMNTLFRHVKVIEAKKSAVPNWGIPQNEIDNCRHSVFLSANEEFFAFFPAYSFIAINEHYSHPASRFIQRYDFLKLWNEQKQDIAVKPGRRRM